ncbi:neuronal acetylcholine receptor subunit beta-4-like [Tubulanus polymorphus]|uniref:neuronal acetylcholine receptor subunit beta-4-like n=1 Tax=Tubulanus polymorphus TaxID=672921 RepID=UPI003DA549F6
MTERENKHGKFSSVPGQLGPRWLPMTLILLQCVSDVTEASRSHVSAEEACIDKVLSRPRNTQARPVTNSSEYIHINISMGVTNLIRVENEKQSITVAGYLSIRWRDDSIGWTDQECDGVSRLGIKSKYLWIPDIFSMNSNTGVNDLSRDIEYNLVVTSDGTVQWWPIALYQVSCQLDMTYFPFDKQYCEFEFESGSYSYRELRLTSMSDTIDIARLKPSGEWSLLSTSAHAAVKTYGENNNNWSYVIFNVKIARKPLYYILNIIVPLILLSLLVLMIFYLPPESGEKISLGMTSLVAFSVFQLLIVNIMPKSSDQTPILGQF